MAAREIVPFHEAKVDRFKAQKLINGLAYDLPRHRRVEVWEMAGKQGYSIRIFRPTKDDKIAALVFGLSPSAAKALCAGLTRQLSLREKAIQPIVTTYHNVMGIWNKVEVQAPTTN